MCPHYRVKLCCLIEFSFNDSSFSLIILNSVSCLEPNFTERVESIVFHNMAGMRPGGFSDDENSDEDQFLDYDETVNGQYVNRSKAAASVRTQV